jgi:hypothetical protein
MSTIKALYGTNNQAITCTITSLANATGSNGAGRASTAVDNTTNLFLDALVQVKVKTSASALANDKAIYVYAYGTADGGTDYTDGITGTDAAFTATNPPNVRLIGVINAVATSTTYVGGPWSVAAAFGGVLPDHWGIFVVNFTGQTLDASVGSAWYQGVQSQAV